MISHLSKLCLYLLYGVLEVRNLRLEVLFLLVELELELLILLLLLTCLIIENGMLLLHRIKFLLSPLVPLPHGR